MSRKKKAAETTEIDSGGTVPTEDVGNTKFFELSNESGEDGASEVTRALSGLHDKIMVWAKKAERRGEITGRGVVELQELLER